MDIAAGMEHLHSLGVLHVSAYPLNFAKQTPMSKAQPAEGRH